MMRNPMNLKSLQPSSLSYLPELEVIVPRDSSTWVRISRGWILKVRTVG